jgi:hypothetical protein
MTKLGKMKAQPPAHAPQKASAQVADVDGDLDGERSRERLAYCNGLPHLLLGQPFSFANKLSLYLADERDGTAEAEKPQPEEIGHHLADAAL